MNPPNLRIRREPNVDRSRQDIGKSFPVHSLPRRCRLHIVVVAPLGVARGVPEDNYPALLPHRLRGEPYRGRKGTNLGWGRQNDVPEEFGLGDGAPGVVDEAEGEEVRARARGGRGVEWRDGELDDVPDDLEGELGKRSRWPESSRGRLL